MRKIIVITTEGDNREDGNVYYSNYFIVESDTLKFDEPIFKDEKHGPRADDGEGDSDERMEAVIEEIKALGYTVTGEGEDDLMFIEVKAG